MSHSLNYAPELRLRGFRVTSQRAAILQVLRSSHGHISPVQVYRRARRRVPGITEPTVYRTLDFLTKIRLVWPTRLAKGRLTYEFAAGNHHHLVCSKCGAQAEIKTAALKRAYARLETASGYVLRVDHVTLSGVCPRCQAADLARGDS